MNKNKLNFAVFLVIILSISFSTISKAQNEKPLNSITIEEMKDHMYFLASDYLGGRVSYEPGYKIAAEYCASQFKSAGLNPIMKDKTGNLSFFQNVPLKKRITSKNCDLQLISSDETITLKNITDFKIPDIISDFSSSEKNVVFIGYGISEPKHNWDDLKDINVKGKAVIMIMGTPIKKGEAVLPSEIDKTYQSVQGFMKKYMALLKKEPSAVIVIADEALLKQFKWEIIPSFEGGAHYAAESEEGGFPNTYLIHPKSASKFFKNQEYSPENIKDKGLKGYKCFDFKDLKIKSKIDLISEETIYCRNIIAYIEGTDEKLKNEYITLTAHLDHIKPEQGQICNGADDNASGSIGVMEIAEAMVENPPKRSVIFALFTAEEMGLIGSNYFVNNPPMPIEDIVFNANLDMIGRTDKAHMSNKAHAVVLHQKYFDTVQNFINDINSKTVNWPLYYEHAEASPGDSDHTSFHNKGIPNFHFCSGHHEDLHRPTDDADKVDYIKMQKIAQLAYILVEKLANTETLNFK